MTIPKLTDHAVSRLPLESGRAELLEEIMTTVATDRQPEPTPNASPRRSRWLVPLAVAAAVATVASSPLWWDSLRDDDTTKVSAASQPALPGGQALVLDAPGWTLGGLGSDGMRFGKGGASLEITSYDAEDYDSYVKDREHIADPPAPGTPIEVLGKPAQMWAYTPTDHTAIRVVEDGHWLELRGDGMDEAGYLALLGQLRLTTQAEFEASLPNGYVPQAERSAAAARIVRDIQDVSGTGFPQGSESPSFADGDAKDAYQFGAEVAGAYACAWFEVFEDASTHNQAGQAAEAAQVLGTSRQWPVLQDMNAEGDYPEVVWELADQVVAGQVPDWYREGLGC